MTMAAIDHTQMIGVNNQAMIVPRIGMMLMAPKSPGAAANAITRNVSAKSALVWGSGMTLVPTTHTRTAQSRYAQSEIRTANRILPKPRYQILPRLLATAASAMIPT